MRNFFPQTSFNHSSDRLQSDTSLTSIINTLVANTPTSLDQAGMYWTLAIAALDAFEERFGLIQDAFDTQISQALTTVGLTGFLDDLRQPEYFQIFSDVIFGSVNNDTLNGGIGNDLINSGAGDDVIFGGAGNDILEGASGNDTVNGDDGDDIIKWELKTSTSPEPVSTMKLSPGTVTILLTQEPGMTKLNRELALI